MKKTLVSFGALALVGMAGAAGFAEEFPDAQKTLPGSMGWMQGFPPAQEKTLHASDGSFFEFPALRYSVNHIREFYPTRNVSSGKGKKYSVKQKLDPKIDSVTFTPWDSDKTLLKSPWMPTAQTELTSCIREKSSTKNILRD